MNCAAIIGSGVSAKNTVYEDTASTGVQYCAAVSSAVLVKAAANNL